MRLRHFAAIILMVYWST